MPIFEGIKLPSDEPVQYVGVYTLRWGEVEQPSVGFIPLGIDTKLAKAAPELLEAARKLLPRVSRLVEFDMTVNPELVEAWDDLYAAIAKAEDADLES